MALDATVEELAREAMKAWREHEHASAAYQMGVGSGLIPFPGDKLTALADAVLGPVDHDWSYRIERPGPNPEGPAIVRRVCLAHPRCPQERRTVVDLSAVWEAGEPYVHRDMYLEPLP